MKIIASWTSAVDRLWTVHPKYLAARGLVALWRETQLAQKVLHCETNGYRNHPQLIRFKDQTDPVSCVATYLRYIHREAVSRGYKFDATKIASGQKPAAYEMLEGPVTFRMATLEK